MTKEYLFLYPIWPYLNECVGRPETRTSTALGIINKVNEIIEYRYRQRGFGVNWVFFSIHVLKSGLKKPDLSITASEIAIKEEDRILTAGICFSDILSPYHFYPKPGFIFSQLPRGVEKLVIGGFHESDCVDKLARTAYRRRIPTIVDEDTTSLFFKGGAANLEVPLIRDEFPPQVSGSRLESERKFRKNRPWFTQI